MDTERYIAIIHQPKFSKGARNRFFIIESRVNEDIFEMESMLFAGSAITVQGQLLGMTNTFKEAKKMYKDIIMSLNVPE